MRILHIADFHGAEHLYEWLSRECRSFDLVALSGDLLNLNQNRPIGDQIDRVLSHLKKVTAPLALSSGNHDCVIGGWSQLEMATWLNGARRKNVWIDGDSFELGGHRFTCIPWGGKLPDAGPEEIWLIHSPPDDAPTAISRGGADWGSFEFGELCRNRKGPWLALSGHVHDPQSWRAKLGRTWSLNPGCPDRAARPNHIVIDFKRGVAVRNQASGETDFFKLS